jgi:geranylgeranyl pyrophosphate synthase
VPTINAEEGPAVALVAGDLLIGLANRLAATAGAGSLLGDALVADCAGRALEAEHRHRSQESATTALHVAELRTGTLLATACLLGAVVTGAPADGLREYGLALGAAVHLLGDGLGADGCTGARSTLQTVDDLVERAATARPELAGLARGLRDRQLALLPRNPRVLSS